MKVAEIQYWAEQRELGDLRILTFSGEDGALCAIAAPALFRSSGASSGQHLIAAPGFEEQAMAAFQDYCAKTPGRQWLESEIACATVSLPQHWDEYLKTLQPPFRFRVSSALRNLEARPEAHFRLCENVRQLEGVLLFFNEDKTRDFHLRLGQLLLERQWLRLTWLEWNGNVLAFQYGVVCGGVYSELYDEHRLEADHWEPAIALKAWSIRQCLKEGLRAYIFRRELPCDEANWGAEVKAGRRILPVARGGSVVRRGPEPGVGAHHSGPSVLSERAGERNKWLRSAAARCYFHSGLPSLGRRLRERYEFSITANGEARTGSLHRRKQGSARILYYHRVNDEDDPFFDAISTGLFEEQMRYLARHYRVVSMTEVVHHLTEGGSPETLVGITFDDGYQDNYQNAFPILRRYNLPATIFLTTGSLDSGEPLWFEQLAEAVKKTPREFVDIEIDIPRRLWTCTPAERLECNRKIFALLRLLDDADRNRWLPEILRRLGAAGESERRNKMLTWDQVRLMKAHGIDFGGHTVTHPFLSRLTPSRAAWEVSECKRRIEQELQQSVDYFAYPNGREEDLGPSNKEVLRAAGYRAAMTTIWGMNHPSTDRMEMRRGGPWEDSPALFAYKLDWYQLTNQ